MGFIVALFSFVLAALQIFYYYDELPEIMAIHFSAGGEPNGWMSRGEFIVFYFGLLAFMLLGILGMRIWVAKMNPDSLNVPNKEYWFAPERLDESVKSVQRALLVMAIITAASVIVTHQMLIMENIAGNPVLNLQSFWIGFTLYSAVVCGIAVWFYWRFRKPARIRG